jgi:hypothetical protein
VILLNRLDRFATGNPPDEDRLSATIDEYDKSVSALRLFGVGPVLDALHDMEGLAHQVGDAMTTRSSAAIRSSTRSSTPGTTAAKRSWTPSDDSSSPCAEMSVRMRGSGRRTRRAVDAVRRRHLDVTPPAQGSGDRQQDERRGERASSNPTPWRRPGLDLVAPTCGLGGGREHLVDPRLGRLDVQPAQTHAREAREIADGALEHGRSPRVQADPCEAAALVADAQAVG